MSLFRSLEEYYRRRVGEANRHFDVVETTVSHLFRRRHPALDGRSYGGAFLHALTEAGYLAAGDRVFEIGGGAAGLARGFVEERRTREGPRGPGAYTILDLAPSLIAGQRANLADLGDEVRWVRCDAQRLPLADAAVRGVVISNEVIADFDAVRIDGAATRGRPRRRGDAAALDEALAVVARYGLEVEPRGRQFLNLGSIRLLEELHRALAPGGRAAIAEYGRDGPAEEAVLYDGWFESHTEYSIDFRHMRRVAEALGFEVEERNLHDFLGFRADVPVLNYTEIRRLRWFARDLDVVAWTEDALATARPDLLERFDVTFRPAGHPCFPDETPVRTLGGFRGLFRILLLRKA